MASFSPQQYTPNNVLMSFHRWPYTADTPHQEGLCAKPSRWSAMTTPYHVVYVLHLAQ